MAQHLISAEQQEQITFRQNVSPLILKRWLRVVSVMLLTSTTIQETGTSE
jgi:hypothetical protein